ncbi:HD-GYP domain-containing protein [Undibacterium curvum]|uniref:HD-GYP domain-containing protein n=1 Tax=Undibacterium curvum TaxID=2762294 RepID=UPI003D0D2958
MREKRKLRHSLVISIADLRTGMFVAELDRPWEKTDFLIQGFLLTELIDLQTLQGMVNQLTIDPSRSDPGALLHLPWDSFHEENPDIAADLHPGDSTVRVTYTAPPAAEQSVLAKVQHGVRQLFEKPTASAYLHARRMAQQPRATQPEPYYLRFNHQVVVQSSVSQAELSSKLVPPSTPVFSHFIETLYPRDVIYAPLNWMERAQEWVIEWNKAKPVADTRKRQHFPKRRQHPEHIPQTLNLVIYQDRAPMQEELGHASVAVERTQEFLSRMSDDIKNGKELEVEQVKPAVMLLTESIIANPSALMWLIRMQSEDTETYNHGIKVAVYLMVLGRHLGFARPQLNELGLIGLLLDVGKLSLPEELLKKPGKLEDDEREMMRTHVDFSLRKLQSNGPLSHNVYLGISQHHERLDGSGYPAGLKGKEISIFGRMAAIADSFAAMTSQRSYDSTRSAFDAMKELFREAETQLHAPLVEDFVQAIGIFPIGSLIELSSGEAAIVLEHNKLRRLEPKILILTDRDKNQLEQPYPFSLMHQDKSEGKTQVRILRGLPDGAYGIDSRRFYQAKSS